MVGGPAEPGQVREGRQRGDRGLISVQDEAGEQQGAGDASRRTTTQERGGGERDGAGGERQEAEPDGIAGGRTDRNRVARERREGAADQREREKDGGYRNGDSHHMTQQLLEGDPPASDGRCGRELEAASPRLHGEGGGKRQDRPEASDEREERAVFVLDVSAERLDVDGLPGEALHDRRDGSDQIAKLVPRLDRRELGHDRLADTDEDQAKNWPDHDHRAP
jgi:hypothetical protein